LELWLKSFHFIDDPTVAEAIAAWQAVNLCVDKGFRCMALEGDSMTVDSALNQSMQCWSSYEQLMEDTKAKIKSLLSVEIKHVRRTVNTETHTLAKHAIMQMLDELWVEECSYFIRSIVIAE
jgi:ribonuclease HI